MYEAVNVLDYDNRKIWVKRIGEYYYFINGCLFACKSIDKFNAKMLSEVIDTCYDPEHKRFNDNMVLTYSLIDSVSSDHYCVGDFDIRDNPNVIDSDSIELARKEYSDWVNMVGHDSVYVDNCRDMSMDEYLAVLRRRGDIV